MDFKGYARKKAIALKRNFYTIPFVFNIITLVIFTCAIYVHAQVCPRVDYQETNKFILQLNHLNALFLFIITLFSILAVVAYIKYMGRIKNYFMLFIYYVLSISQIILEVFLLIGIQKDYQVKKVADNPSAALLQTISLEKNSIFLIYLHFVFLGITLIIVSFAPLIQKLLKSVKFSHISEDGSIEVNATEETISETVNSEEK